MNQIKKFDQFKQIKVGELICIKVNISGYIPGYYVVIENANDIYLSVNRRAYNSATNHPEYIYFSDICQQYIDLWVI
jgi:hypothetical protein